MTGDVSALASLQVDSLLSYAAAIVFPALDAVFPVLPSETIIITRHGKPIARLIPNGTRIDKLQAHAALARIRTRAGNSKEPFDWAAVRAERDAGRP